MSYLQEATSNLDNLTGSEDQLLRIQRALLLLKSHMETFRKKYAYNFRRLALEGKSVPSHADLVSVRHSSPLRIVVQPGGSIGEKVTFDMSSSDLVSELRAEITSWWEEKVGSSLEVGSMLGSLLGGSSVIGGKGKAKLHLRLISQGQELHRDMDERSLSDVGFKDMQLVFANIGSTNRPGLERAELPPFPGRSQIPMLLLLESKHFDQLFSLMSKLSSLTATRKEAGVLDTRAQILSRRVWEIILLLPTNPNIMRGLQEIDPSSGFESLLDPNSAQKLLYSFYIIDWLGRPARLRRFSGLAEASSPHTGQVQSGWIKQFISAGGLKHLFSVFLSGVLGRRGDSCWSEWSLDCLGFLLRLLVQFGVDQVDADTLADQLVESTASTKKRNKWIFSRHTRLIRAKLFPSIFN
ncbi:ubiquitin carboxyl-terminal hydrolase 34 isoform X2 [Eurytemora carolleeae]|uniref:ubiquitin carboxyl-terminal hydrolase 34 isoform X2 n=1 Tax=Eurytemora carolleeae TaxID=1294199 RepID=UPI000C7754B5|nr:ubiquitin carboxyl-terminal hydrolase 34 isoform X2 [Eurytemora carolleeae]|eukprot:XP_023333721.1 ubiquitin carboxyl-terminal hydrolase 34-like isoform X2 [Eurytemora affinis]